MKTASIRDIKQELKHLPPKTLQEAIIRLAKFKKENKELLGYLLFESSDEQAFIQNVKEEIDEQFLYLNRGSIYLAKKTVRKVLRTVHKYIRFSGNKETEIELLIYFCKKMRKSGLRLNSSRVMMNMYFNQVKRIKKVLSTLHEDLQFDYEDQLQLL